MHKKNYFIVLIAIGLLILAMRISYSYKLKEFKGSLKELQHYQLEQFRERKARELVEIAKLDRDLIALFNKNYNESSAVKIKDTIFSFLFFKSVMNYNTYSLDYFVCLKNKCNADKSNITIEKSIDKKVTDFEMKYGLDFVVWYPKLKDKLWGTEAIGSECGYYFFDSKKYSYKENLWDEFEGFLVAYRIQRNKESAAKRTAESEFLAVVANTRSKLHSKVIEFFNNKVEASKSQILRVKSETKVYNSPNLGAIDYEAVSTTFVKSELQSIIDAAFEEQWQYNSLATGNMPYANCYGSSNFCGAGGCSQIKVKAGVSGDVVVTIKNGSGRVVRHAYIKAGRSYTFNVPDGMYQTFFYSGTGWNPNKQIPSNSCTSLKGGFVANEEVTKDKYIELYSQIMSYELILQQQGNFSTQPSSKLEAF